MKPIKPEEFQHVSDLEVIHRPTGTNVSTFRYTNPADLARAFMLTSAPQTMITIKWKSSARPVSCYVRMLGGNRSYR